MTEDPEVRGPVGSSSSHRNNMVDAELGDIVDVVLVVIELRKARTDEPVRGYVVAADRIRYRLPVAP